MSRMVLGAAAAVLIMLGVGDVTATAPACPNVFLPEGYGATCSAADDHEGWRLEVVAEDAPLGEIGRLTITSVAEPVEDPFSWLQERLVVDLSGFKDLVTDLLEHPDSPFAGVLAPELFDTWLEQLGILGQLPLRGCAYPFELADKDIWQMDCRWTIGPVQPMVRLQVVDPAHDPYLVTIWTADEQRQRHLQAIANSLEWRV